MIACAAGDFATAENAFARFAELQRGVTEKLGNEHFRRYQEAALAVLEGRIALRKGDIAAATAAAERADKVTDGLNAPDAKEGVHFLRGLIALQQDDPASALAHFADANQDFIEVTFFRAMAHEALGQNDEARLLFQEVADWNFNGLNYALIRGAAIEKLAT